MNKRVGSLGRSLPVFLSLMFLVSCVRAHATPPAKDLILATTTSTQDSGLLDVLIPVFEAQMGYQVKVIAVGTGQALKMGEWGNADVLLVHDPFSEREFMAKGFGAERLLVMHNDFVIVGPAEDPARVKGSTAVDAFRQIANSVSPFLSRGDDSGTHKMELSLWKQIGLEPNGDWYWESGQGMSATLKIAAEKDAYTLTDRATYLANRAGLDLEILVEGDPVLLNVYHVIVVNPEKWPKVNLEGAKAFAEFMVSKEAQELIAGFGVKTFGQALFTADAGKTEQELGLEP